jgi:CheY-like chemotaxis protein
MTTVARTLLLVDDDPDIRETLAEFLGYEGYAVTTAGNGREALDQLREGLRPCAVLLDLMMPVMDGFQFLELRQQDAELAAMPVIVISAGSQALKSLSGVELFPKPLDVDRLLAALARYC